MDTEHFARAQSSNSNPIQEKDADSLHEIVSTKERLSEGISVICENWMQQNWM